MVNHSCFITTLTGVSGAGKTLALNCLVKYGKKYNMQIFPKFVTRPRRDDDDASVICVSELPPECDIVYTQFSGHKYGFSSRELFKWLIHGISPVIVINDLGALQDVQSMPANVKSFFLHRKRFTREEFESKIARPRGGGALNSNDINNRYRGMLDVYDMYIKHMDYFDAAILNTVDNIENLETIIKNICDNLQNFHRTESFKKPKLYAISGAPGSNKDFLVQNAGRFGAEQVRKHTSRLRNRNDGSEIICSNDQGFDLSNCDVIYKLGAYEYGFKFADIYKGIHLDRKNQVLVVSNIEVLKYLENILGDSLVKILMHSDMTPEEYITEVKEHVNEKYLAERVKTYYDFYNLYKENASFYPRSIIDFRNDKQAVLTQFSRIIGVPDKSSEIWLPDSTPPCSKRILLPGQDF